MDKKTLAKLAILAKKDPAVAEQLAKQANAVSDEELNQVAGGDVCLIDSSCWIDSRCWGDSDHIDSAKWCVNVSDDTGCVSITRADRIGSGDFV